MPPLAADPGRPEDRPFGRAALRLEAEGVAVVLGHEARDGVLSGVRARPGAWEPARARVAAAYDRFPSRSLPDAYAALLDGLVGVPLANPPSLERLCRDKLATQRALPDLPFPAVEDDPAAFAPRLAAWGAGFLKPRHGALGRGVRRVVAGDPLPAEIDGDPALLQRAVPAPDGWAGVAVRVLAQRVPDGWIEDVPVVRRHRTDPVVNAARGADVRPLAEVAPDALERCVALATAVAETLARLPDGEGLAEVGVDLVLDRDLRPHPIEVNGRPRGHLEALYAQDPARWARAHVEACCRPLRWLALRFAARSG